MEPTASGQPPERVLFVVFGVAAVVAVAIAAFLLFRPAGGERRPEPVVATTATATPRSGEPRVAASADPRPTATIEATATPTQEPTEEPTPLAALAPVVATAEPPAPTAEPAPPPATPAPPPVATATVAPAVQATGGFGGNWRIVDTVTEGAGAGQTFSFDVVLTQSGTTLSGGNASIQLSGVVDGNTATVQFVQPALGYTGTFVWTLADARQANGSFTTSAPNSGTSILLRLS